jgi:hypothetical protein
LETMMERAEAARRARLPKNSKSQRVTPSLINTRVTAPHFPHFIHFMSVHLPSCSLHLPRHFLRHRSSSAKPRSKPATFVTSPPNLVTPSRNRILLPEKKEMARGSHGRSAQMMSAEWTKSTSTESSICKLVGSGVLPDAAIGGWRQFIGERFPDPCLGELIVFEDFYRRGFGMP